MTVATYKFSSDQYHQMAGLFAPETRQGLIKGEIITMSPIGRKHGSCVARLTEILGQAFFGRFIIWVQSSIKLANGSEPQPNLVLLRRRSDFYEAQLPEPENILLGIEVADSTIDYDRNVKMPLYAEFGIPEAWLIDVNERTLTRYTEPSKRGYKNSRFFDLSDSVTCENQVIAVKDIFGAL